MPEGSGLEGPGPSTFTSGRSTVPNRGPIVLGAVLSLPVSPLLTAARIPEALVC